MKRAFNRLEQIARQPMAEARLQQLIVRNTAKRARGESPTPAESLELGLANYDASRFSDEEALCYVRVMLNREVDERIQAVYDQEYHEKSEAIRVKHGLGPDEFWVPGEGPEEDQALSREFEAARDRVELEVLREHAAKTGHPLLQEAADLFASDHDEFERRFEVGWQSLFGPIKE